MRAGGQVHWCEGLFLQPHHLQVMQRQVLDQFAADRQLVWSYPYGVAEARLLPEALANKLVRFERLRVVMPSGREVSVPDNADLQPLDIKQVFEASSEPLTILLGVPLWDAERANTTAAGGNGSDATRRLYRVADADLRDENTGDNPQRVQLRRVNARLLLPTDDRTGLETLPVLRVAHGTGKELGTPRAQETYFPPSLVLSGWGPMRSLCDAVAEMVEASRSDLANKLREGAVVMDNLKGAQVEQVLRLRTLNRFAARLRPIFAAPGTTPFQAYLELRELQAELAALKPDRDPFACADYNHDDPAIAFNDLYLKIKALVRGGVTPRFRQVPFALDGRAYVAVPDRTDLNAATEVLLGIKTKRPAAEVAELVENRDRFKVMSRPHAMGAYPGVKLAEERAPDGLPTPGDIRYFRLMTTADPAAGRMWDEIKKDGGVAVRWNPGMDGTDFELGLYLVLPQGRIDSK